MAIINLPVSSIQIKRPLFLHVHFFKTLLILIGFVMAFSATAQEDKPRRKGSQIIDDTTKQVYGARTSRYFYEEDIFYNRHFKHPLDTAIHNYHRFTFVQRYNNFYQDLGNIGTAITPIFYKTPALIGATPGFNAYDLYWESEALKYFDTRSPYSNLNIIWGGLGRSITRVAFSRNVNPRWNFGFNFRSLLIDKPNRSGKGDRNVKGTYYDIYTSYQTKDSTYRIFFNFRRNNHQADESGGIQNGESLEYSRLFAKQMPNMWLTNAESRDRRNNVHLFHQLQVFGKGFQLYHTFDNYNQHNNFYDVRNATLDKEYFRYVEVDSAKVKDESRFTSMRNEAGLKGNLAKLFYNGYYALRQYNMSYKYLPDDDARAQLKGNEHYLGGRMSLFLDSIGEVNAWGELEARGNFRLEGSIKSKWFEASLKQLKYEPTFLQQAYRGSHDLWNNDFIPVNATYLNGYLHYNSRILKLSPGLTFATLSNYVYFKFDNQTGDDQWVLPVQSGGTQVIASPELKISLTMLRHLTLSGQGIYTKLVENEDNAFSVPEYFVNAQLSYANIFFKGNMDMQMGFDVHYKSAYNAMGYDPVIQQYYRQDFYTVKDFPIIDFFFNMKIKSGRLFVKYNNIVQAFTKSGYLTTPYYPGQRNVIDFGFDLLFYD